MAEQIFQFDDLRQRLTAAGCTLRDSRIHRILSANGFTPQNVPGAPQPVRLFTAEELERAVKCVLERQDGRGDNNRLTAEKIAEIRRLRQEMPAATVGRIARVAGVSWGAARKYLRAEEG